MNSIRQHLVVRLTVSLFLIFGLMGTGLYLFIRHSLLAQFDTALRTTAKTFAAMSELELEGEFGFEFLDTPLTEFQNTPTAAYFEVWDEARHALARSPSLDETDLPLLAVPLNQTRAKNLLLPDGRPGRAMTLHFAPRIENVADAPPYELAPPGKRLYVVIARSLIPVHQTLQALGPAILLSGVALAITTIALVRFTVRRALQPMGHLAAEVSQIDQDNLDHRFASLGIPLELQPIIKRLNELLERLKIAFLRERRFTANVSHELRTPIAELRALAEVGADCVPPEMSELRAHFEDALKIAAQLDTLVSTLLALARAEAGSLRPSHELVALSPCVLRVWKSLEPRATERSLQVDLQVAEDLLITSDPGLLNSLLHNLFENATLYTPAGGSVQISLQQVQGRAQLTLVNDTDSVTDNEVTHFCEPFWRQDESRTGDVHSGLGLTVVDAFARLLHAEFSIDLPGPDQVRFRLRFALESRKPAQRAAEAEANLSNASSLRRTLTT